MRCVYCIVSDGVKMNVDVVVDYIVICQVMPYCLVIILSGKAHKIYMQHIILYWCSRPFGIAVETIVFVIACCRGVGAYVKSVVKARYYVHGHYAKVKVTILNSSIDDAAGAVRVHWRLTGLPQMKIFFMFWKFAPFRFKETAEKQSE
jgi:hypothetical protein